VLVAIVLTVNPSVMYLIRNLEDPAMIWKKFADQFEKKKGAMWLDLHHNVISHLD